jgi:hypothetical protein
VAGEYLYEDKTSLRIEEVDASEAITPARMREIHGEQLGKLERERGPDFLVRGRATKTGHRTRRYDPRRRGHRSCYNFGPYGPDEHATHTQS